MKRFAIAASLVAACIASRPVLAEQQVTLESGATLVGDVTFDGDAIVIEIDGATNRIPLADVESVAPLAFDQHRQARHMLLTALEMRLWGGTPKEAVGLLAEAARLAPEDPQIAFWYASTLVDAGSGKAASQTFEAHHDAIEAAFPDRVAKLAERIQFRKMVEMLPPKMLERIDELNAAAAVQPANAAIRPMAVVFRVLDQFKDPIDQAAIQINANGNDERLEQFTDGYYLFTYARRRDESDQACRLRVAKYGLQPTDQQFPAGGDQVAVAGEFVVHRYVDADKRPFRITIVDRDGSPLTGVRIELRPAAQVNNAGDVLLTDSTAAEGRATITTYPGVYDFVAAADGFNSQNTQIEISADPAAANEQQLVLYRAVVAAIRVAWRSIPLIPGAEVSTGETSLQIKGGQVAPGPPNVQAVLSWLRPVQVQDGVSLQLSMMPYGPPMGRAAPWVKKLAIEDEASGDELQRRAQKGFDAVDLKEIDDVGEEFETVEGSLGNGYGPGTIQLPAKAGDVFVGVMTSRDARTGQPLEVSFKAMVEQSETDDSAEP